MGSQSSCRLLQICIAPDGRLKATFDDNVLILVDSRGTNFIWRDHKGTCTRQLCAYALGRYSSRLALVLQFRNRHCDNPTWCKALVAQQGQPFTLGFRIPSVAWQPTVATPPATPSSASKYNASTVIKSVDGSVRLTLDLECGRCACFLLPPARSYSCMAHTHTVHARCSDA